METQKVKQEVKSEKITLVDLIRGFMEFAVDKGKLSFPSLYTGTRPWHEFLYVLKKNYTSRFPELECIGEFDWDGPYPKSRNFGDVTFVLTSTFTCTLRGYDRRTYFVLDGKKKVNLLATTHLELLETMLKVACETKDFFKD